MTEDTFIERLYNLDTCAISDALDSLRLKGVALGLRQVTIPKKIAGQAVTVKLVPYTNQISTRHLGTAAIEAASKGDVVVIEHGQIDVAGWGGNLTIAAKKKGISGVIVDGACRDIDEMKSIDFPVYARSAVPITARGRIVEHSFNEKIVVAGIKVNPRDYVIADGSGIVFIPNEHMEAVLDVAERIVEKEAMMAKAIREGNPVSAVMGENYEAMLDRK